MGFRILVRFSLEFHLVFDFRLALKLYWILPLDFYRVGDFRWVFVGFGIFVGL